MAATLNKISVLAHEVISFAQKTVTYYTKLRKGLDTPSLYLGYPLDTYGKNKISITSHYNIPVPNSNDTYDSKVLLFTGKGTYFVVAEEDNNPTQLEMLSVMEGNDVKTKCVSTKVNIQPIHIKKGEKVDYPYTVYVDYATTGNPRWTNSPEIYLAKSMHSEKKVNTVHHNDNSGREGGSSIHNSYSLIFPEIGTFYVIKAYGNKLNEILIDKIVVSDTNVVETDTTNSSTIVTDTAVS
jgi:hypothetical protein